MLWWMEIFAGWFLAIAATLISSDNRKHRQDNKKKSVRNKKLTFSNIKIIYHLKDFQFCYNIFSDTHTYIHM